MQLLLPTASVLMSLLCRQHSSLLQVKLCLQLEPILLIKHVHHAAIARIR
jgi:hypothetical protein